MRWTSHRNGDRKTITVFFLETTRHCGQLMHLRHSGSVAPGRLQTNSSSLQSGLLSAKATPELNTRRSNLRSRGSVAHPRENSHRPSVRSVAGPFRKPLGTHLASDQMSDISTARPGCFGARAKPSRPRRSPGFRAIAATSTTARSKAEPINATEARTPS